MNFLLYKMYIIVIYKYICYMYNIVLMPRLL